MIYYNMNDERELVKIKKQFEVHTKIYQEAIKVML